MVASTKMVDSTVRQMSISQKMAGVNQRILNETLQIASEKTIAMSSTTSGARTAASTYAAEILQVKSQIVQLNSSLLVEKNCLSELAGTFNASSSAVIDQRNRVGELMSRIDGLAEREARLVAALAEVNAKIEITSENQRLLEQTLQSASERMSAMSSTTAGARAAVSTYAAEILQVKSQIVQLNSSLLVEKNCLSELAGTFNASSSAVIDQRNRVNQLMSKIGGLSERERQLTRALSESNEAFTKISGSAGKTEEMLKHYASSSDTASQKQEKHNRSMRNGVGASNSLAYSMKRLIAVIVGGTLVKGAFSISDSLIQSTAHLDRINDSLQTTKQFTQMVYYAAQQSGASYTEMAASVGRLGTLAGNAFGNTQEIIRFSQLMNKSFALGRSPIQEQTAAMYQLTQAMAAGRLQGDEFRSILENAPILAQAIADKMGVPLGRLKELSSQGLITADIVKSALFEAEEDIDKAWGKLPLTWGRAWKQVANTATMLFQPVLERMNKMLNSDFGRKMVISIERLMHAAAIGANSLLNGLESVGAFLSDNFTTVVLIAAVAAGVFAANMFAAAIASLAAAWPLLLIVAGMAAVIVTAQAMGATIADIMGFIGMILGTLYAYNYNLISDAWNIIATFAEFLANIFVNPLSTIQHMFFDVFGMILGIVETVANAIDSILQTDMASAISGFRNDLTKSANMLYGEKEIKIERMGKKDTGIEAMLWEGKAREMGVALENFDPDSLLEGMGSYTQNNDKKIADYMGVGGGNNIGTVGNIGSVDNIKGEVNIAEEDLKMIMDLSDRKYMNEINMTQLTPNITVNVSGTDSSQLTAAHIADSVKYVLAQQAASHTAMTYA